MENTQVTQFKFDKRLRIYHIHSIRWADDYAQGRHNYGEPGAIHYKRFLFQGVHDVCKENRQVKYRSKDGI